MEDFDPPRVTSEYARAVPSPPPDDWRSPYELPEPKPQRFRCGWGGSRCTVILERRGICPQHREELAALRLAARVPAVPAVPTVSPAVPEAKQDKADAAGRLPIRVRAARIAQATRLAGSLTRQEAAEAADALPPRGILVIRDGEETVIAPTSDFSRRT